MSYLILVIKQFDSRSAKHCAGHHHKQGMCIWHEGRHVRRSVDNDRTSKRGYRRRYGVDVERAFLFETSRAGLWRSCITRRHRIGRVNRRLQQNSHGI